MQENTIEQLLIDLLIEQWYTYHLDRDIAPGSDNEMRTSFEEMILSPILKDSLKKLNPDADTALLDEAYRKITHLEWSDIVSKNENFHKLMRNGCTIERFKDWETRWEYIRFFDLEKIENNDFRVVNQFKVWECNHFFLRLLTVYPFLSLVARDAVTMHHTRYSDLNRSRYANHIIEMDTTVESTVEKYRAFKPFISWRLEIACHSRMDNIVDSLFVFLWC